MTYRPIAVDEDAYAASWGTDPEWYVSPAPADALERIPSFILMQAYESAWRTYYTCGGHKLAARMNRAMTVLARELRDRGIIPEYSRGGLTPGWSVPR